MSIEGNAFIYNAKEVLSVILDYCTGREKETVLIDI